MKTKRGLTGALARLGSAIFAKDHWRGAVKAEQRPLDFVCQVRQYSDEMRCLCGTSFDTNDSDPPRCPIDGSRCRQSGSPGRA